VTEPSFTIFVFLRALPAWLSLARDERRIIGDAAMDSAIRDSGVTVRYFDAEAFAGFCSDISMFEAKDLRAFYAVMERLRDSPLFATPLFELVQIIPTVENGYRHFDQHAA